MRSVRRDINLTRGDDYEHEMTFEEDGSPLDVSDHTFAATIRSNPDSDDAKSFTIDVSQAASGVIVLTMAAADTAAFSDQSVWDLQWTTPAPASKVQTLVHGFVNVRRDVTHG